MPNATVWDLDPHTAAKHSILRRYLLAYYPKLASAYKRVLFVDGFAGPGVYTGGEMGSPVIALDTLTGHHSFSRMAGREFEFLFIEERDDRYQKLQSTLAGRDDPPNVRVQLRHGEFAEHVDEVLNRLERDRYAPAFVMVDPFGVKGRRLELLSRLAEFPKTELLITFMYEPISRFLETPEFEPHLDDLFGTSEWRQAQSLRADDKKAFLSDLYAKQLRGIGMEYVRLFEMRDAGNRTEYFLAFGTQHEEGLRVIKEAMWKVDPAAGASFSDFTVPSSDQSTLFSAEPDYAQLRNLITDRFAGQQDVAIGDINDFVLKDTAFRETHGRSALREAEKAEEIKICRPVGKTKNYLNVGTRVTFPPAG